MKVQSFSNYQKFTLNSNKSAIAFGKFTPRMQEMLEDSGAIKTFTSDSDLEKLTMINELSTHPLMIDYIPNKNAEKEKEDCLKEYSLTSKVLNFLTKKEPRDVHDIEDGRIVILNPLDDKTCRTSVKLFGGDKFEPGIFLPEVYDTVKEYDNILGEIATKNPKININTFASEITSKKMSESEIKNAVFDSNLLSRFTGFFDDFLGY